jgi:DNA invertase Pin-like site-specific DNA recombinase
MLIGYMRVSTDGDRQTLDLQKDALLAAGVDCPSSEILRQRAA